MRLIVEMPWEKDLSVNHYRMGPRGNWHIKPHVEAWMERLAWEIKAANAQLAFIDDRYGRGYRPGSVSVPVLVGISFRYPDKHKRDDHNTYKILCDSVAVGLGIDDKDIRIRTKSVEVDRGNPGFTIEIMDDAFEECDFGERLGFDRILSADEMRDVEKYLAEKYGVELDGG